jgi:outer membrane protein assembly factor BamB
LAGEEPSSLRNILRRKETDKYSTSHQRGEKLNSLSRKAKFLAAIALTIFALSAFAPAIITVKASPASPLGADWIWSDGNQANQNYNPQSQIGPSNLGSLQVSWLFPIPAAPPQWAPEFANAGFGGVGIATTPLVYKGIVYVITSYEQIFAMNAANGKLVWQKSLPFGPNATTFVGPGFGGLTLGNHFHNSAVALTTNNLAGGPTLWIAGTNQRVYGLDALTGTIKLSFAALNGTVGNHFGIAGNLGVYSAISPALLVDQDRGIIITSVSGTSQSDSGRGFFRGWDVTVNPPKLLWTTFTNAPQDGSNPNFDLQQVASMKGAWIFDGKGAVDLKGLSPSVANATLYNDWGFKKSPACTALFGARSVGGVGQSWGGPWVLDPHTGIAYVATNNRNPYDSGCIPGPDLWSASILALDVKTGNLIWGFQTNTHEGWDWDCSWNQILANETINGQNQEVVMKSCKDGYVYQLNAQTGALIWSFTPPFSDLPRCQYCHLLNPLNRTQMTSDWVFPNHQSGIILPGEGGGFENDMAYDPTNNMLVAVQHNLPGCIAYVPMNSTNYDSSQGTGFCTIKGVTLKDNATAYGVDAATGQELWHFFIPDIGYRGGVTISNGVAYLTLSTGYLTMVNDKTGAVLANKLIGGPLTILPSIGANANGTQEIFLPIASPGLSFAAGGQPGALVVLAPSAASLVTSTQTQVQTSVVTSGSTVTASGTSPSGIDPSLFYGVTALAVIFIIATGFLATRRRKPVS